MALTRSKFKAMYGGLNYSKAAENMQKRRQLEADLAAEEELKRQKDEEKFDWKDVGDFGKSVVSGFQQGAGAVADTAIQGGAVLEDIKQNLDPSKSDKQKDAERLINVKSSEEARKVLHNLSDWNGNKIVGTSKADKASADILSGNGDIEDIAKVGLTGLNVGANAMTFANPVAGAVKNAAGKASGKVVSDIVNNAIIGAIGGGAEAGANDRNILQGVSTGAAGGAVMSGIGNALGAGFRKLTGKGGRIATETVEEAGEQVNKSVSTRPIISESLDDIKTKLDDIHNGKFPEDVYDIVYTNGKPVNTDDIARATKKQIKLLEEQKNQLIKQTDSYTDIEREASMKAINQIDDKIDAIKNGQSDSIMETLGEGTTKTINSDRLRSVIKELNTKRDILERQASGKPIKSQQEIDADIKNIQNGNYPDDVKIPHKEVTNVSEVAFSESMPQPIKKAAIDLMDQIGDVDRQLDGLMDKNTFDNAHSQMDKAYNDRLTNISEMPEPRQVIERQKLYEQYINDLAELDQKFETDKPIVEQLTLIKDHLATKERELLNDVNMAIRNGSTTLNVPDEKLIADKLASLEKEKRMAQFVEGHSQVYAPLIQSVEDGVLPSKSVNPITQEAIEKTDINADNLFNTGKNPNIIDVFGGMPRRVLRSFGDAGKKISDTLDEAVDKITINDHQITNQVWKWVQDSGGQSKFNQIAKALDGDMDMFSSLNKNQQKVFNQVRDMFNDYADRLELPKDGRIKDYLPHIFDNKSIDDIDAAIAQLTLGKNLGGQPLTVAETKALNKVLKGLDYETLDMVKSNSLYSVKNGFLERRTGAEGYSFNLADIILTYTHAAHNTEFLKPAYATAKVLSEKLNASQNEYLAKVIHSIGGRPSDELGDILNNTLEAIWSGENKLYSQVSNKARKYIYDATMGLNVGAAVKNLSQGSNTYAKLGTKYYTHGTKMALQSWSKKSSLYDELLEAGVLYNKYSDLLRNGDTKSIVAHKAEEGLWAMFTKVEQFNRATAYFGAKQRYLDKYIAKTGISLADIPEDILAKAKKSGREMSRQTQFEFSALDNPIGLQSTTAKNITQFQSYNLSQVRFLKDLVVGLDDSMFVKESGGKILGYNIKPEGMAQVARLIGANLLFISTIGAGLGMKPSDMLPYYDNIKDGEIPESPLTKLLVGNKSTAGLLTLAGDIKDRDTEKLGNDVIDFSKSAASMLVPGGSQAKKTIEGIQSSNTGYSTNEAGNIQFAQDKDTISKTQNILFGKYSSNQAQDWIKQGFPTLTESQSDKVRLLKSDEAKKQYVKFYQSMKKVSGRNDVISKAEEVYRTSPAKAERLVEEYNQKVLEALGEYYKEYDSIPSELRDYMDSRIKIQFDNIAED